MRLALQSALALLLLLITVFTAVVCWSGYRVTSAMNYGALRAKVIICIDARHMALRDSGKVPQNTVDNVLARQIWAHYYFNPKRKLPHHILLLSSDIGWQTFWSPDERRQIYESLERRMRPCPGALKRFRELQSAKAV
jgi:hypothetical protein